MGKRKRKINFSKLFEEVRMGSSLYRACCVVGVSTAEFYKEIANDERLSWEYHLALADYADKCTDEIKMIAEELKVGNVENSTAKLLIETQKWLAQKFCSDGFDERGREIDDVKKEIVIKFI